MCHEPFVGVCMRKTGGGGIDNRTVSGPQTRTSKWPDSFAQEGIVFQRQQRHIVERKKQ
jgi:hypothetical protein